MKRNVGKVDKIIRIILGVVIIFLGYYYKSWWGLLGLIPLITGLVNFCALYTVFKINSCKKK